ncbi:MAG: MMPL family transporter [Gemmatimonadales bacterium]
MRTTTKLGIAARAGRWSARHRAKAIVGWLVFVFVAANIGGNTGRKELSTAETQNGQSAAASRTLQDAGFQRPAAEQVLIQVRGRGDVLSPAGRAAIGDVVAAVRATSRVTDVRSPLAAGNAGQVSRDRRSAVVLFAMTGKADTASKRVEPVLGAVHGVAARHPQLLVEEFGSASATKAVNDTIGKDFSRAESISIPLTFGVLLVAFGALMAALVPLVLALTSVMAAGGLLALASQGLHVDSSASTMLLLIGLAVGVDYSLFYIRRQREERAAGRSTLDALDIAAATSGRSVLVSGLTVMAAMAGMFLTGQHTFIGMAEATILVVAVAVLGSLTVLPATLSALGDRLEKGRIPWLGKWLQTRRNRGPSRTWTWVLNRVLARPAASALAASALLIALAVPALSLHTSVLSPSQELPHDMAIMKTYLRVQHAFPGGPQPAQVVVSAPDVTSPPVAAQIRALRREATATHQILDPVTVDVNHAHDVAVVTLPLAGDGQSAASRSALSTLRNRIVPRTVARVATVNVGGSTAASVDFNHQLRSRAPFVFAFVLALAFLLLMWSFRSIVIAATGVVLNVLSVGAAYGVLVAVFQWGWGKSLLGLTSTGAITSWLPLFLFVILLGLSMDYHVFTVSRIQEGHDRGLPTGRAIHDGIVRSAGVITSAAIVMVFVFLTFATLKQTSLKQLGVGLAVAVLLDATVVRAVLLPATMKLLGERNWYLPRAFGRIPSAPADAPVPAPAPAAQG